MCSFQMIKASQYQYMLHSHSYILIHSDYRVQHTYSLIMIFWTTKQSQMNNCQL